MKKKINCMKNIERQLFKFEHLEGRCKVPLLNPPAQVSNRRGPCFACFSTGDFEFASSQALLQIGKQGTRGNAHRARAEHEQGTSELPTIPCLLVNLSSRVGVINDD